MRERRGDWFQTFTGKRFFPLDADPEDICIEDIAHSLALVNRFGGHLPEPYNVAQHSMIVSIFSPEGLQLCGLMHDATEAYLGDMVAPLKRGMPDFQDAEARLWSVIANRFDLPDPIPAPVMEIDLRTLLAEARDMMPTAVDNWPSEHFKGIKPLEDRIRPMPWQMAESSFLKLPPGSG